MIADLIPRDHRCVSCGTLTAPAYAEHHRILGHRSDNRWSNRLLHCGTGNVPPGCHGLIHKFSVMARDMGYIVTRHGPREATLTVPVWYDQPARGRYPARVGWYYLTDTGTLSGPLDLPPPTERLPEPWPVHRSR